MGKLITGMKFGASNSSSRVPSSNATSTAKFFTLPRATRTLPPAFQTPFHQIGLSDLPAMMAGANIVQRNSAINDSRADIWIGDVCVASGACA